VFEFVEEALDEIAFAVERVVTCALHFTVGLGWNHWGDLSSREGVEQRIGIVSLVAEEGARVGVFEQRFGACQVVILPRRQHQFDRIASALLVFSGVLTAIHSQRIVELAAKNRLRGMYWQLRFVNDGGLMYYGPNLPRMFQQSAALIDKILKGSKPGDIPVQYAKDFELIINLRTAKALGITIPPTLLARADGVIE